MKKKTINKSKPTQLKNDKEQQISLDQSIKTNNSLKEQIRETQSVSAIQLDLASIPLIICSYCEKNVPNISLRKSKRKIEIEAKCHCLKEVTLIPLAEYLKSLVHFSVPPGFKIECSQHKKSFANYCKQCEVNCCVDCLQHHQSHRIISICLSEYSEPYQEVFNKVKADSQKYTSFLLEIFLKLKLGPNQMETAIMSSLKVNEQINEDLILLFRSLRKTSSVFKTTPSYELMEHRLIVLQNPDREKELVIKDENSMGIKKTFEEITAFLERNHVVKQCSGTGCISRELIIAPWLNVFFN